MLVHFVISANDLPKDFVQMTEMDRVESQQNLLSRGDPPVPHDLGVHIILCIFGPIVGNTVHRIDDMKEVGVKSC